MPEGFREPGFMNRQADEECEYSSEEDNCRTNKNK